jgi:hypothetical protein
VSNPARGPFSPITVTGLDNDSDYVARVRAYNLINTSLGDVDGNRLYGPWSPLSAVFSPGPLFHDSFTDTNATLLTAHSGDGVGWATVAGYTAPGFQIQGNALRPSASNVVAAARAGIPADSDALEVRWTMLAGRNAANNHGGACIGWQVTPTENNTMMTARHIQNTWVLFKYVAGTSTQVGASVAATYTPGVSLACRFQRRIVGVEQWWTLYVSVAGDTETKIFDYNNSTLALSRYVGPRVVAEPNDAGGYQILDMELVNLLPEDASIPSAPTSPSASAGDGLVSVSFTAPSFNGGAPIDQYRVTRLVGGTPGTTQLGNSSPIGIASGNGTAVTFTVAAHNAAGWGPESTATNTVTPAASGGSVTATPLWNGDTFTVVAPSTSWGGEGTLTPWYRSSAWNSSLTGDSGLTSGHRIHSNTDPAVHGSVVVDDPTGLVSVGAPTGNGSVRKVIKNRNVEGTYASSYSRMDTRSPILFNNGDLRWIVSEFYVPSTFPTFPTSFPFWNILEIFGEPYAGTAPQSLFLRRNSGGTGNNIVWSGGSDIGDVVLWSTPLDKAVWHILVRKIQFSTDAAVGYIDTYYSKRASGGTPTTALTLQTLTQQSGVTLANGGTRRMMKTLNPAINGSGSNHLELKNYHWAGMVTAPQDTYWARTRVYDGATPITQIDPFTTGLV